LIQEDFVFATDESEVKEDRMKPVSVAGKRILLAKIDGRVYGVSNRCPHMGCSLAMGKLKEYFVVCPCHGQIFDVRDGQHQITKETALTCYECKIENSKIYVKIPSSR
jgi:3-phenylpropionate/trans-cinnamate dioxygenase ferredoxin subunit